MSRPLSLLHTVAVFGVLLVPGQAANSSATQEIHELRRDLQMQGRKIDALTSKIAELTTLLKQREEARTNPEPVPAATAVPASAPVAAKTPEVRPAAETSPEAPKATPVPVPATIPHAVAKGETLTGIAKQYNVALSDLLKLNKNTNDRKLQIGQVLKVPAVKPAEPPTPPTNP